MVSDPKLQAAYHIFSVARFPWQSPQWYEAKAEAEAWASLATLEELGLASEDWHLFSNGVKPRKEKGVTRSLMHCPICGAETAVERQYIGGRSYHTVRFCSQDGSHYHIMED